jgi:hypothetical protein
MDALYLFGHVSYLMYAKSTVAAPQPVSVVEAVHLAAVPVTKS